MAPPATPSAGNGAEAEDQRGGQRDQQRRADEVTIAGTKVLPVPRMTLASVLNSQTRMTPANTMLE